ncbi:MAG: hypothetical protein EP330_09165 [Deltaproteobacteria bacterium]|nr:MAG: hypothetical protein EP330_09165 [Deltaproteobacteria bacterium]
MTQGFYQLLNADPAAPTEEIRAAYARVVAGLERRHKAIVEQGGDPSSIELSRAQADEAWAVLSDPARRRRYDAMRALSEDGWTTDASLLWDRVAGALIHPATAAAVDVLQATTQLRIGQLPPAPGAVKQGPRRPVEHERTITATTVPRMQPAPPPISAAPSPPPPIRPAAPQISQPAGLADPTYINAEDTTPLEMPDLRVVAGTPSASEVLVMQQNTPTIAPQDMQRLIQAHGYSGRLLRAVRELHGMTLQDMADTTRISVRYLEGVENEAQDVLPSATFVRGYVREMARLLELDDQAVVAGYMQRFG